MALLGSEPDWVSDWFTYAWDAKTAKTFDINVTALGSASPNGANSSGWPVIRWSGRQC
ncbi:hypothetical protein [Nocardia asteroides]|uniref:hypothetical protein n=1 Tax=Nocardia asteroides TaxID=1824 RepID=UPI0033D877EB